MQCYRCYENRLRNPLMDVGAIIQARMSSQRCPGKVLRNVNGKPMLMYIIEKLQRTANLKQIVVSTSKDGQDDLIEKFCRQHRIECYRGSLDNVVGRFCGALNQYPMDAFVRVNGDSPLIDSDLIEEGMEIFNEGSYDLVTNVFPRSYPKGQSVEVVNSKTFKDTAERIVTKDDMEHVTRFFYQNADEFKIFNMLSNEDRSGMQLSIDTEEDMKLFDELISQMDRPHWSYHLAEILKLYDALSGRE